MLHMEDPLSYLFMKKSALLNVLCCENTTVPFHFFTISVVIWWVFLHTILPKC